MTSDPSRWDFPHVVAGGAGVFFVVTGLWAMLFPQTFFDAVATFEPYNQHLVQDIGAFQLGLGAVLIIVLFVRDALAAALLGVGVGSAAHVVSHVVGHDLGGTPAVDIPFFTIITVLLAVAGGVRWRRAATSDRETRHVTNEAPHDRGGDRHGRSRVSGGAGGSAS
jgi:hypothetical protein